MENFFDVIDLTLFLDTKEQCYADKLLINKVLNNIRETGILIVKDPRVNANANNVFIDMMERYYEQPDNIKYHDARKQHHYQVGITPANIEKPLDHCEKIFHLQNTDPNNAPHKPTTRDPKERFFWRLGNVSIENKDSNYSSIEVSNVIPNGFREWKENMDTWGNHLFDTINTVSRLLAVGLDLEPEFFVNRMKNSDTLLAPTGINVADRKVNDIVAGYHYDISFLSIHGKSRYPGLYIWTRNGQKVLVKIPDGCLLIQAGKQLEHVTGGYIQAGFHEVVITQEALDKVHQQNISSTWRVSSTMFAHYNNNCILSVIDKFTNDNAVIEYPPITKGEWLIQELNKINL
jgi:isopenicillin N synthase-like dioxygenase